MRTIKTRKIKILQTLNRLNPWVDVIAIFAWGILMLHYRLSGKLYLLIHPNFFELVSASGAILTIIGIIRFLDVKKSKPGNPPPNAQHVTLFPPGFGSRLLLITAILGLVITPGVFASDKALKTDTADLLSSTRVQPQEFRRSAVNSEDRSLVDWVRTLKVYPEPDKYSGQKARVKGFVIHSPDIGDEYLFLARFVLTCCAADAYPIGLPVKLEGSRQQYPPDTWLEVEGTMITGNIAGKRQLTIAAKSIKKIDRPKNPYSY